MTTALCFVALGTVIGWLPNWLLRGQRDHGAAPRLAVLTWFVAAGAAAALWLAAAVQLIDSGSPVERLAGVAFATAVFGRLAWTVCGGLWRTRRQQRAHLATAQLVGHRDVRPGVLIIDVDEPIVYCVRAGGGGIVMSRGAHRRLSEVEAQAVLAHERTHLRERHDVIVTVASAVSAAFPLLGPFRAMGRDVGRLLEMRADDAAARAHGRDVVVDAIASLSLQESPTATMAAHGPTVLCRAIRLTDPISPLRTTLSVAATAATAALLAAAPMLGPWLPLCPHPMF